MATTWTFAFFASIAAFGIGNMVHNLRMVAWDRLNDSEYGYDWALEANEQMKSFILNNDHQQMINFSTQGRAFDLAIPSTEHFIPSLYALALKEENEKITLFNDKAIGGSLTMTSFKIESA